MKLKDLLCGLDYDVLQQGNAWETEIADEMCIRDSGIA